MIVAWQFIARNRSRRDPSRRDGMIGAIRGGQTGVFGKWPLTRGTDHTVPYGTDSAIAHPWQ